MILVPLDHYGHHDEAHAQRSDRPDFLLLARSDEPRRDYEHGQERMESQAISKSIGSTKPFSSVKHGQWMQAKLEHCSQSPAWQYTHGRSTSIYLNPVTLSDGVTAFAKEW